MNGGINIMGRHALITGGGTGIGAAIAKHLGRLGATVTILGRREEPLEKTARALSNALTVTCDVSDENSVQAAFNKARKSRGAISILVNNAGIAPSGPFQETSTDTWDEVMATNLRGAFLCSREAISDVSGASCGRIINIASTAGLKGYGYVAAYCASKHGLIGLTRSMAAEFAGSNFTVNAVCPGYTDTEIVEAAIKNIMEKTDRTERQALKELVRNNPQRRLVTPEEVATVVGWLCSEDAGSITGQAIAVAGGEVT